MDNSRQYMNAVLASQPWEFEIPPEPIAVGQMW